MFDKRNKDIIGKDKTLRSYVKVRRNSQKIDFLEKEDEVLFDDVDALEDQLKCSESEIKSQSEKDKCISNLNTNTIAREYEAKELAQKQSLQEAKPSKVKRRSSLGIFDIYGKKKIEEEMKANESKNDILSSDQDQISLLLSTKDNSLNVMSETSEDNNLNSK